MANSLRVWVFQTGEPMPVDHDGSRPMRAMNLSQTLVDAGHEVVLWTADFKHNTHQHRYGRHTRVTLSDSLEVRLVHSPGYTSNLGPGRLADHAMLGLNLKRLLRGEAPPAVAFVGYPPVEPATVLVNWLHQRRVPSVLDVKDAWPEVLLRGLPDRVQPMGRHALWPYFRMMHQALGRATSLTSTAEPFLAWCLEQAGRDRRETDWVFPLTSRGTLPTTAPLSEAEAWWDGLGVPDDGRFRAFFVGTLHSSYDFAPVVEAAAQVDVQVVICGDGSHAERVRQMLSGLGNVVMPGWVSAEQAEVLARRSTIALAPIAPHPDFSMSVPNKFYDAMAKGLPVLTSLTGAAGELVEERCIGRCYTSAPGSKLRDILLELRTDPAKVRTMSDNARALYQSEFAYDAVYGRAVENLERVAAKGTEQRWVRE